MNSYTPDLPLPPLPFPMSPPVSPFPGVRTGAGRNAITYIHIYIHIYIYIYIYLTWFYHGTPHTEIKGYRITTLNVPPSFLNILFLPSFLDILPSSLPSFLPSFLDVLPLYLPSSLCLLLLPSFLPSRLPACLPSFLTST